jgi:hypothetical protein
MSNEQIRNGGLFFFGISIQLEHMVVEGLERIPGEYLIT